MDFEKYKNNDPMPTRPKKPTIKFHTATSEQMFEYAKELKEYEEEQNTYKARVSLHHEKTNKLNEQFKKDALADVGLSTHPKADKAYSFAWHCGNSSGLCDVYSWLQEIAESGLLD